MNCNCWCRVTGPSAWTRSLEIFRVWLVEVNCKVARNTAVRFQSTSKPIVACCKILAYSCCTKPVKTTFGIRPYPFLFTDSVQFITQSYCPHTHTHTHTHLHTTLAPSQWKILSWTLQDGGLFEVRSEGIVCVSATGQRWWQRYRCDEVRDMTGCYFPSFCLR
jgi:hypothetical protein